MTSQPAVPKVQVPQPLAPSPQPLSKSGGPRLPQGKAVVSQNALKHGLRAKTRFIACPEADEDPADFDALLAELRGAYQPEGTLQDALVGSIADYTWRLRRAQTFEVQAITDSIDRSRCAKEREAAAARAQRDTQIHHVRLDIGEARLFHRYLSEHPDVDLLDSRLTFDWVPVVQQLAAEQDCELPECLIEQNNVYRFAHFLAGLGFEGMDVIREAMLAGLERLIQRQTKWLSELEADRAAKQSTARLDPDHEGLMADMAIPDKLKLIIRYESALTHPRDRAVADLYRLKAASAQDPVPDVEGTAGRSAGAGQSVTEDPSGPGHCD